MNLLNQALGVHEAALQVRAKRMEVLAQNIANADTPNYKARDLDFAANLQAALQRASTPQPLQTTAGKHFPRPAQDGGTLPDGTPLLYRTPAQGAVDGNTVDMDVERNNFADNALRYEAGVTFINSQIKGLMAAIQGGQ